MNSCHINEFSVQKLYNCHRSSHFRVFNYFKFQNPIPNSFLQFPWLYYILTFVCFYVWLCTWTLFLSLQTCRVSLCLGLIFFDKSKGHISWKSIVLPLTKWFWKKYIVTCMIMYIMTRFFCVYVGYAAFWSWLTSITTYRSWMSQ